MNTFHSHDVGMLEHLAPANNFVNNNKKLKVVILQRKNHVVIL